MTLVESFYYLDLFGTMVFAISGATLANENGMDLFGGLVIASVTAVGGGTLRDIIIGSTPVGWINDLLYPAAIFAGIILSVIFRRPFTHMRKTFFLFDTIGIGVFTILGLEKCLRLDIHPFIAVMMGTVSAVFGGVIRDILTNEVPLIFRKEIYATACLLGAAFYMFFKYIGVPMYILIPVTMLLISSVRFIAVKRNLSLPKI